jgi:uncharacterized protein YggE
MKPLMRLIFLAGLVALVAAPAAVAQTGASDAPERTLIVGGEGIVNVVPDTAIVTAGVVTEADTAGEALSANNAAMSAMIDELIAAGIAERDIQTASFEISPRYFYPENEPARVVGYTVTNRVRVTIRDIEGSGELLDAVVRVGANSIQGIQFTTEDLSAALDEARRAAVADALHKAEIYADAGGFALGPIVTLAEESTPPPMPFARAEMAFADQSVPIQAGENEVSVTVRVTWEIAD